jgi:cell division protein FtsI/penicillin-binding protein 2
MNTKEKSVQETLNGTPYGRRDSLGGKDSRSERKNRGITCDSEELVLAQNQKKENLELRANQNKKLHKDNLHARAHRSRTHSTNEIKKAPFPLKSINSYSHGGRFLHPSFNYWNENLIHDALSNLRMQNKIE